MSIVESPVELTVNSLAKGMYGPDGAPFFEVELQRSLVPRFSLKDGTPSYARDTTADFTDFQAKTAQILSNESRFQGSRRVRNLIVASRDMTNGAYSTDGAQATIDSAEQITFTTTLGYAGQSVAITDDGSGAGGRTFTMSVEVKLISGTASVLDLRLQGTAISNATQNIDSVVTDTYQRFSVTASTDAAGTTVIPYIYGDAASGTMVVGARNWQLQEVTGELSHAPGEYVSAGVGTGVEINTLANATSPSSEADATTGYTLAGSGAHASIANTDSEGGDYALEVTAGGGGSDRSYMDLDTSFSLVDGKDYVGVLRWRHKGTGGGGSWSFTLDSASSLGSGSETHIESIGSSQTTFTEDMFTFTHSATTRYGGFRERNAGNDGGVEVSSLSIKEADHGANRDGVQYFNTHNGNTVDSSGLVTERTGPAINSSNSQLAILDGVSGTYISTPDSAAASVTGDLTLIAWVAPDDWTPAAADALIAKYLAAGNEQGYVLQLRTDGKLRLILSSTGANSANAESSVATGFADGTGHWVRSTWTQSTNVVNTFTSDQPLGTAISGLVWTQLGDADVAMSGAIPSIFDNAQTVKVGSLDGTSQNLSGKVSRAVVIASTDPTATPAVDYNANDYDAGVTQEASSPAYADVVTNGDFSTSSGWTLGDGWSISGGTASSDGTQAAASNLTQSSVYAIGSRYKITFDISGRSAGNLTVYAGAGANTGTINADGSYEYYLTAAGDSTLYIQASASFVGSVDNVTVTQQQDVFTYNGAAVVFSPLALWADLPGSVNDYVVTPDAAANSITGNNTIVAWAAADDWTPASNQSIISKYTSTGDERAYRLFLDTTGALYFFASADGTYDAANEILSTVSTGFSNGTGHWVRASWVAATGVVTFYTSDDSPWTPYSEISWTQLGDTGTTTATAIADTTATLVVGAINDGATQIFAGKIMRAAVFAGTDITGDDAIAPSVDYDSRAFTPGVSTATMSTGEVWTLQGNASIEGGNKPSSRWDAKGPQGYLAEGAGTNLQDYSQDIDNAGWTKDSCSVTSTTEIAPDGTATADVVTADGTANAHRVKYTTALSAATVYTASTYIKKKAGTEVIRISLYDITGGATLAIRDLDLATGVASQTSNGTTDIDTFLEALPDGWYRFGFSFTSVGANNYQFLAYPTSNTGASTDAAAFWGVQIEAGTFPSTYIPTTSSSATRNADVLTYSAVGNADSFPMTVSADYTSSSPIGAVVAIHDGDIQERMYLYNASDNKRHAQLKSANTTRADIAAINASLNGVTYSQTGVFALNDVELYLDGISQGTDVAASPAPAASTVIAVGNNYDGSGQPYGPIRNLEIYLARLNDSQVATL